MAENTSKSRNSILFFVLYIYNNIGMKTSLGYVKDLIAFIASVLFFALFAFNKIEIRREYIILFFGLVFIFDGIFSFFPGLHCYDITLWS